MNRWTPSLATFSASQVLLLTMPSASARVNPMIVSNCILLGWVGLVWFGVLWLALENTFHTKRKKYFNFFMRKTKIIINCLCLFMF
jgi:hypothetical protein